MLELLEEYDYLEHQWWFFRIITLGAYRKETFVQMIFFGVVFILAVLAYAGPSARGGVPWKDAYPNIETAVGTFAVTYFGI